MLLVEFYGAVGSSGSFCNGTHLRHSMHRVYVLPLDCETPVFITVPVQGPLNEHDLPSNDPALQPSDAEAVSAPGGTLAEDGGPVATSRGQPAAPTGVPESEAGRSENGNCLATANEAALPDDGNGPPCDSAAAACSIDGNADVPRAERASGSQANGGQSAAHTDALERGPPVWARRLSGVFQRTQSQTSKSNAGSAGDQQQQDQPVGNWFDRQLSNALRKFQDFEKCDDKDHWKYQMRRTLAPKDSVKHMLHAVASQVVKVEIAHPSTMSPSAIQQRLHDLAGEQRKGRTKNNTYLSAGLLPLSAASAAILPLVGKFFVAANLYHMFDSYRATQGMEALQQLIDGGCVEFVDDPQLDAFFGRDDVWESRAISKGKDVRIVGDSALEELSSIVGHGDSLDLLKHAKLTRLGLPISHGWEEPLVAYRSRVVDRMYPVGGRHQSTQQPPAKAHPNTRNQQKQQSVETEPGAQQQQQQFAHAQTVGQPQQQHASAQ